MKLQDIKNKGLSIFLIAVIAGSVSCKKLIEIPPNPPTQIPENAVFSDSADIMSAVAGIYSRLNIAGGGSNIFNGMLTINTAMAADELTWTSPSPFQTNTYTATDGTIATLWSSPYTNLYQINACLAGIASTTAISSALKQSLLGELKVLRALNYFYLVNLFGGVPLVTTTDYKVNAVLPRSPVDEVYALIISDLTDARKVLTASYPSTGRARPNLYTADALLARVYLYRGQYANAETMASEVINSGLYDVASVALIDVFHDGNNESIWQLPAVGTGTQTSEGYTLTPYTPSLRPSYQINSQLLNSFENNDQRKTTWIKASTASSGPYYYAYKYRNRNYANTPVEGYVVLRLAEQYLIRAEVRAQQGGTKLADAAADLNVVRRRAGLGATTETTQPGLLNAILHERQVEFCFEWGHRWFDLKRIGTIDAVLSPIKTGWKSTNAILPVPFQETQNNPFLTQNPGY